MQKSLFDQVTDEEFIKLVQESLSATELIRKIGYTHLSGSLRKKIDERCQKLNVFINKKESKSLQDYTKGELFSNRANWQSARSSIQKLARKIYFSNNSQPCCAVCGYNKQIEVAHIKAVSEFNNDITIAEINNIQNLVALCPNHHWEFDNGFLKYNEKTKQFEDTGKESELKTGVLKKESWTKRKLKIRNENGLTEAQQKVQNRQRLMSKCPQKEILEQDLQKLSLVQIGKKYGVTDNSVRKWCKRLNIDYKIYGYHRISVQRKINDNYQIEQYDLKNNHLNTFNGFQEVIQFIKDNNLSKAKDPSFSDIKSRIIEHTKGYRKSCYGYTWIVKQL